MFTLTAHTRPPAGLALHWSQLPSLPDALGVAGPFAGVSDDTLLVAGGANFPGKMPWAGGQKVWHDEIYALSTGQDHWKLAGRLPHPLAYGVSITIPAGVVCIGGSDARQHHREVFLLTYHGHKLAVRQLASLPVPLANAAGALVGSTLYLTGGAQQPGEQSASPESYALDLNAGLMSAWTNLPPCPGKARILPVAAAWNGNFYLFGGAALEPTNRQVTRVYLRDAWCYHPGSGWHRLADLPKPCVAGPTPAPDVATNLLLVGGDDGSRVGFQPIEQHPGFPHSLLAYDPVNDAWQVQGEVPAPRATLPTVFWRGQFVIPSGEMRPGVRSPEVWALSAGAAP